MSIKNFVRVIFCSFLLHNSSPRLNSEPKQRTRDEGVIAEVVRASVELASRVVATSCADDAQALLRG